MLLSSFQYDPTGAIVLFAGIALFMLFYLYKKNKAYKAAMAEYEKAVALVRFGAAAAPAVSAAPAAAAGELLLTGVDEKTAAMLIAIICSEIGGDPAQLRFTAIRAL